MSLFVFVVVLQAVVAALLVTIILMQKSEGGGLGVGGSPAGLMSARGAADFMTRATAILASIFVGLSILLAVLAVNAGSSRSLDTSLDRTVPTQTPVAPAPAAATDPLAQPGAGNSSATPEPAGPAAVDPLAGSKTR